MQFRYFFTLAVLFLMATASVAVVPGDASRGAELFKSEKCVSCHSVNGQGGKIAPDLARGGGSQYTPSTMVALMWNHAPAMWAAMEKAGIEKPKLSTDQAADLFAYFYAFRYFEKPGDAARGKRVFESLCRLSWAVCKRPCKGTSGDIMGTGDLRSG
jgi:cytochrome c553